MQQQEHLCDVRQAKDAARTEKYRSEEDAEGNCYDWYVITDHYRYIDKTEAVKTQLGAELLDSYELQADHEYRLCMLELGLE